MRLTGHRLLDALCGEYLLGTLRGGARRRFEQAQHEEPLVAQRLQYWQSTMTPRYSKMVETQPSAQAWRRLERELELARYRPPWFRRAVVWQACAGLATAALLLVLALAPFGPAPQPPARQIAMLSAPGSAAQVSAGVTADGLGIVLRSNRPVFAGPNQSYELWLIAGPGATPVSLAVLGSLDARFALSPQRAAQLRGGATLAVSTEPAGGSPTGLPTGPVILSGRISS